MSMNWVTPNGIVTVPVEHVAAIADAVAKYDVEHGLGFTNSPVFDGAQVFGN